MTGAISVIEEAPTNEPEEPIPTGLPVLPGRAGRKPGRTRMVAAVMIVIALILPAAIVLYTRAPGKNPTGHGIPSWPEVDVPPWRLYMNVTDHKTLV